MTDDNVVSFPDDDTGATERQQFAINRINYMNYFMRHVAMHLTFSELRLMLYIIDRTLGWGKLSETISLQQFIEGIIDHEMMEYYVSNRLPLEGTNTEDQRPFRYSSVYFREGCGCVRQTIQEVLPELESKRLIIINRTGGTGTNRYQLNLNLINNPWLDRTVTFTNDRNGQEYVKRNKEAWLAVKSGASELSLPPSYDEIKQAEEDGGYK